ncbi:hypothetical protein HYH03_017991 [Edaphochlamys debaryana]|uniref:Protein kinase domain-containing protein n=1 Tax=Edaphochlamys debaryana TaxID=47281 RepID=A0A836BNL5_9CHLO|nr:hypothetical protein HYH03_017991 [Edaphochlamys debaryana]|eukprot:KAG2483145.1 hypothetical protein HYH03_017991 [Edaphochlamys debaryana]
MFSHLEGHLLSVGLNIGVLQLLLDSAAAANLAQEVPAPQSWGRAASGAASDTASGTGNLTLRSAAAAFTSLMGSSGGGTGINGTGFGTGILGSGNGNGAGMGSRTGSHGAPLRSSGAWGFLAAAGASTEEAQPDLAGLHWEQLVRLCAPEELVADLTSLTVISVGAQSVTFQALWRGARVAVRFSSCSSAHPAASAVIRQALVSKALAHPNILQHYSIRCCHLTPASAAASGGRAASTATATAADTTATNAAAAAAAPPATAAAEGSSHGARAVPPEPRATKATVTAPTSAPAAMAASVAAAAAMSAVPAADTVDTAAAPPAPDPASAAAQARALASPSASADFTGEAGRFTLRPHRPPPCNHRLLTTAAKYHATYGASAPGDAVLAERDQLLAELGVRGPRKLRPPPQIAQQGTHAPVAGAAETVSPLLRPLPLSPSGGQVSTATAVAAPAGVQAQVQPPPLLTGPGPCGPDLGGSASSASLSFNSQEGFGNPSLRHALSLHQVAALVRAREGDLLTATIMEHADHSTLDHAVQRGLFSGARVWSPRVALRALLRTALEIAFALQHLHGRGITHGSLCPASVLLKSSNLDRRGFTAKVTNFSLARVCHSSEDASPPRSPTATATATATAITTAIAAAVAAEAAGTGEGPVNGDAAGVSTGVGMPTGRCGAWGGGAVMPRTVLPEAVLPEAVLPEAVLPEAVLPEASELVFMAPEQLGGAAGGKPSDVYAFGVTLFVMATAALPYPAMGVAQVAAGVAAGTLRPSWPASPQPSLRALCAACWEADPRARPSLTQVSAMLQAIEHDVRHQLRNPPPPPLAVLTPAARPVVPLAVVTASVGAGAAAAATAPLPLAPPRRVTSMALDSEASALFSADTAASMPAAAIHTTYASVSAFASVDAGLAAGKDAVDAVEKEGALLGTL